MPYCPYCGSDVTDAMSFCPDCGASLTALPVSTSSHIASSPGDYRVYISGLGSAVRADVIDLLEDTLGYPTVTAASIIDNLPAQIAGNLSLQQAAVIAQVFEEYGVQLSVTNGEEAADISSAASNASLFNTDGSFLASAVLVLGSLTAANRISSIIRPKKPGLLDQIFHSLFNVRRKPPVHVRRIVRPQIRNVPPAPVQPVKRAVRTDPVSGTPRRHRPEASNPSMRQARHGHSGRGQGRH